MSQINLPGSRKVGHLTLVREPRTISPREFNALSASERLDMIRATPGRAKYDLLIEASDAEDLAKALSAQELLSLVREVGEEDVADLVAMLSAEQLTAFLDLDAWREGLFDGKAALRWLMLLAEAGEVKLWETLSSLDLEILALLFGQFITVSGGLGDLLEEDRLHQGELDRIYQVDYRDSELAKQIGGYLDVFYRRDRDLYLGLMEMIRTEQGAELEELVLQQRNGRLMDQGIPDPEGAAAVYARLSPENLHAAAPAQKPALSEQLHAPLPGNLLIAARPGNLLGELLSAEITEDLAWELACLANKVLVASRADFSDSEQLAQGVRETYTTLEVALGYLSGGDAERAQMHFQSHYLEHLFRLGYTLQLELQQRARSIRQSHGPFLDAPFNRLVEGLAGRRPQVYRGLFEAGGDGWRPFRSYHEVERAGQVLGDVEAQCALFEGKLPFGTNVVAQLDLQGCNLEADDVTLSTLLLTALAHRLLGGEFAPSPLSVEQLLGLHGQVCRGGALVPELRRETLEWLEGLVPGAGVFGEYCLDLWDEGFCALAPEQLDARFVPGLIVKL